MKPGSVAESNRDRRVWLHRGEIRLPIRRTLWCLLRVRRTQTTRRMIASPVLHPRGLVLNKLDVELSVAIDVTSLQPAMFDGIHALDVGQVELVGCGSDVVARMGDSATIIRSSASCANAVPGRLLRRILSRMTRVGAVVGTMVLIVAGAVRAEAQTVTVGGALEMGIERFNGDPAGMNRLDGSAAGWTVIGDVRFGRISARVEGWRDGTVEDTATTNLVANGKSVTIHSSLAHDAHGIAALAGYVSNLSSRVQIAGVGGISSITDTRTFYNRRRSVDPRQSVHRPNGSDCCKHGGPVPGVERRRGCHLPDIEPDTNHGRSPERAAAADQRYFRVQRAPARWRGLDDSMMARFATTLIALVLAASAPAAAFTLNAGKYGATFYWWYAHLPSVTIDRPTIAWDASDANWWTTIIAQARDAGLGWVAPVSWGQGFER